MKDLIIIGAGGFARELLSYIKEEISNNYFQYNLIGFIDDNLNSFGERETGYDIIDTITSHKIREEAVYLCAIADPKTRLKIGNDFLEKGATFINYFHHTAEIRERVKMGVGNIFCPHTWANPDTSIGNFVLVNNLSGFAHDCIIGDACTINGACQINGNNTLGKGVFMGSGAIIVPGRRIGDFVKISAGAVIFSNVKDNRTMVGNPATMLK
ncbi:MAG: NeuD/PglB/VioB family sugar acetyltransferase [Bacilli bacterium]|nr:NeuD/PglB/VioB family sugar acetyltransferase [Bacilli bacterium]